MTARDPLTGRFVSAGGRRDDMKFRPRLPQTRQHTKAAAAHRRETEAKNLRRGILGRNVARLVRAKSIQTASRFGLGRFASRASVVGGAAIAVAVTAAAVAGRLMSGRSFENMGQNLAETLLGDTRPEAVARRQTREAMQANEVVMFEAGRRGEITRQMRQMGEDLYQRNLMAAKGRFAVLADAGMMVNSPIDMLVLGLRNKFVEAWDGAAEALLSRVRERIHDSWAFRVGMNVAELGRRVGFF